MTEEIIVDGVNVAGCKHYKNNGKCHIPHYQQSIKYVSCNCNEWDCDYKQLKRLEQENKELEILAKSLYKKIEELEEENEALAFRERLYKADYEASEQENKELKNITKIHDSTKYDYYKLMKENKELRKANEISIEKVTVTAEAKRLQELEQKYGQLCSVLEEIREIEELAYYSKGISEEPLSQRDFILDAINNYEQRRIKILNKINEVLK